MSDLQIFIAYDPADRTFATALADGLRARVAACVPEVSNRPSVLLRDGLAAAPAPRELGSLSLVLVVLPGRAFTAPEQERLGALLKISDDVVVLPVSSEPTRYLPPAPLDAIVSHPVHDAGDGVQVARLATRTLNLMGLRVASSQRRVLISYRQRDGLALAEALEKGLVARGYRVWRDERRDEDDVAMISPGSQAQKTIEKGIVEAGFVLLLDTPEAVASPWVEEEVAMAIGYMLPVLPLVVEGPPGEGRVMLGGRSHALREMQREVRLGLGGELTDERFDQLEQTMNVLLLEHFRTRRHLLRETQRRFEALRFQWRLVDESRLLYEATLDRDGPSTPELRLRFLVQCAPYDVLLQQSVGGLCNHFKGHDSHCQYGVLVHQAQSAPAERRALLRTCGGHILLLKPSHLDQLPALLALPTPAAGAA